ncbi:MAG: hypothetical protein ACRDZ6_09575 [Acidimicrobiales bacterium]
MKGGSLLQALLKGRLLAEAFDPLAGSHGQELADLAPVDAGADPRQHGESLTAQRQQPLDGVNPRALRWPVVVGRPRGAGRRREL